MNDITRKLVCQAFYKYSCKILTVETNFSENLKTLRKERGLSQGGLAAAVGVTQQCVSEWERGEMEPTLSSLWRLADFFGISIDVLCGRSEW